jgi:hypothetical protein
VKRTRQRASTQAQNGYPGRHMEGGGQHHGAIVFVHGQMGCAAVYFALFKNRVERQNTVFALVDNQHAAQSVAYVVDYFSFIKHKADNNSMQ